MEVLASCEVLQAMLQEVLHVPVRVVRNSHEAATGSCSTLVVVLTAGLLENAAFAEALLFYHHRGDGGHSPLLMVPVIADNQFQFPTAETYAKLEETGLGPLGQESGPPLVDAYSELFSSIALRFSPLASEAVLKLEVSELCRRRLSTLPLMTSARSVVSSKSVKSSEAQSVKSNDVKSNDVLAKGELTPRRIVALHALTESTGLTQTEITGLTQDDDNDGDSYMGCFSI
mmetsp:Transcript_7753/g.18256  ORF Transcript_7753/g.18256 Transcript_7753/m.18256 type:complete len:230 (-) Transcript_7753:45-734(-)